MIRIHTVTRLGIVLSLVLLILISLSSLTFAQTSTVCPIAAYEGDKVTLDPKAFDPDPEIGPAGKLIWAFGPPFNSQGVWQTIKGMRGIFNFWVSVSDGELKDTETACVEVLPNNRNPILEPVPEVFIIRGENTRIDATCIDPDGDVVEINYRFNGRDVAYILYEPPGTYNLDVTCTDGFGGIDSYRTKIHIDMPEPEPAPPKPAPVPVVIPETEDPGIVELQISDPGIVELQISDPGVVELRTSDVICGVVVPVPEPVELRTAPETVVCEVVLPKPEIIEVRYPQECPPCPPESVGDIDVVVYGTIQDVDTTKADSDTFTLTVQETIPEPAPEPAPEPEVVESEEYFCHPDIERKEEVSKIMGQ